MALGDYNYDEYLNPSNYEGVLGTPTFDAKKWGSYGNTQQLTQEVVSRATNLLQENPELEDIETEEDLEDWWNKEQGGSYETGAFKGIERTEENNFGYVDKPALLSLASLIPGVAGLIGTGINLGINLNNLDAVNAARKELGLEPMTLAEAAKTAITGKGKVGEIEVDGKKVTVTLDDDNVGTDKKGKDTVSFSTAKAFDDAIKGKADIDDDLEPEPFAPVSTPPMTTSPAGGARAASGIGVGWEDDIDVAKTEAPKATESVQNRASGYEGRGLAALAPNGLRGQEDVEIDYTGTSTKTWDEGLKDETKNSIGYMAGAMNGLTVNSGYRDKANNDRVGGAPNSTHMKGTGVDISVKNYTPSQVANLVANARDAGFTKAIGYDTHIHFDYTGRIDPNKDRDIQLTGKISDSMKEGATRSLYAKETDAVPGQRDTALAQIEAIQAPAGKGFMGSPELASNKPAEVDVKGTAIADATPLSPDIDQSRFGYDTGVGLTGMPSEVDKQDPMSNETFDENRVYGDTFQGAQDPMLNETFDENRAGYPAPTTLSTDIYGQPEQSGRVDYAGMSPAEAAAKGMVDRSAQEKGMMSLALAGELSPHSLAVLSNPENYTQNQVETAKAEAAGIIATMENTFASGKYENVETALTSRYDAVKSQDALRTSLANFETYAPTLTGVVDNFYSPDKQGIVPVDYAVTHYYQPEISNPEWGREMKNPTDIGDHRFGILDSQYDIPVSTEHQDKAIQATLDSAPVPTPTSPTSPTPNVENVGTGFMGSPELSGQMMNAPAISEGTFSATPENNVSALSTIDTGNTPGSAVDSGKAFGDSFGAGFGQQSLAGAANENVGLGENEVSVRGEDSFMGFDAGTVGQDQGLMGDLGAPAQGMETAESKSDGGSISVTSVSTGETSVGSVSNDGGSGSGGASLSSIGDAIGEAFGGTSTDNSSTNSISTSNDSDSDDDSSSIGW